MSACLVCAAFVASSLGLVASVGCGGSTSSSSPADAAPIDDDGGQCPATVALTIGAPCAADGLQCAPAYPCGLVPVPLECTCDNGVFACTDVTGNAIAAGGTPACPPPPDAGCPADEDSASLAPCGEVGLLCAYPSACGLGVDSCECTQAAVLEAGTGLLFACSQAMCEASEAGTVGVDASPDGSVPAIASDSGVEADAAGCPADEDSVSLAPCGEVGLLCAYPSACGLGVDLCECIQALGLEPGAGLLFACRQAMCEASEAGTVGVAGGSDATPGPDGATRGDSGPGPDATLDAGPLPDADASPDGSALASDSGPKADADPGGD
jgi:hypothetical protein